MRRTTVLLLLSSVPLLAACGRGRPITEDTGPVPVPPIPVDTGLVVSSTVTETPAGCDGRTQWLAQGQLHDAWTAGDGAVFAVGPGGPLRRDPADEVWEADGRWAAETDVPWSVAGPPEGSTTGLVAASPRGVYERVGAGDWQERTPASWPVEERVEVAVIAASDVRLARIETGEEVEGSTIHWLSGDGTTFSEDGSDTFPGASAVVAWLADGRAVVGTSERTFVADGAGGWTELDARMGCVATGSDGTIAGCGGSERLFVVTPEGRLDTIETIDEPELEDIDRWTAVHVRRRDDVWMAGREVPPQEEEEERVVLVHYDGAELTVHRLPTYGQRGRALARADSGVFVVGGTAGRLAAEVDEVGMVLELDTRAAPGPLVAVAVDDVTGQAVGVSGEERLAVRASAGWVRGIELPQGVPASPVMAASEGRVLILGGGDTVITWGIGGFATSEVGGGPWVVAAAAGGTLFLGGSEVLRSGDGGWSSLAPDTLPAGATVQALLADGPDALVAAVQADGVASLVAFDGSAWSPGVELPASVQALHRGGDGLVWVTTDDGAVHTWDGVGAPVQVAQLDQAVGAAVGSADGTWMVTAEVDDGWDLLIDGTEPVLPLADPAGTPMAALAEQVHVVSPTWGAAWTRSCSASR